MWLFLIKLNNNQTYNPAIAFPNIIQDKWKYAHKNTILYSLIHNYQELEKMCIKTGERSNKICHTQVWNSNNKKEQDHKKTSLDNGNILYLVGDGKNLLL